LTIKLTERGYPKIAVRGKFAFPHALLSSKTCGLLRRTNLAIRTTQMPASFSCQRSFVPLANSDRNVSASSGAQRRFGAGLRFAFCSVLFCPCRQ